MLNQDARAQIASIRSDFALVVAIDALAALMALLRLDRQRRDRARFEPLDRDRLASLLAIAVGAVLDARQRRVDLGDQLALPIAGAQFDGPVGLRGGAVGKVGMILALILEMLQRLLGLLEDVLAPIEQLQPEILPLALVHERLFVGRPVQPLHRQHALTVPTVLVFGFAVFGFEQLHIPLRARDWCEILPARLAYISMVGDRDNNDDEIPPWRCMAASGERRTALPCSYLFNEFNSLRSAHAGFGELDRDPQLDLGQHGIELFVAGAVLEIGGKGFQPQQCALIQGPRQETELEFVEGVEGAAAMLDRAPAPFRRLLDTLQRNERVDAAERPQRHSGALRLGWLGVRRRESAARAAPRRGWCGRDGGAVGSIDAHDNKVCPYG